MLNLNESEAHYIELATHINLNDIDYDLLMHQQSKHTYRSLILAGAFFIIGFALFLAELLPYVKGFGTGVVFILFVLALIFAFHALRYQKEIETRVTYEILQKIQAIEGSSGFFWRLNSLVNACCQEEYGGIPEGVQQVQTSSQAGGIEMSEIRLYKDLLEKAIQWYAKQKTT